MIVCVCTGINDSSLRAMVSGGCDNMRALGACSGLGRQCGKCVPCARGIIKEVIVLKNQQSSPLKD